MKQIPNLFTLLNLVFGCVAIIYIFKNDGIFLTNQPGEFSLGLMIGGVYIFIAALIDFLDGFVARLFNATSDMGAQLDSLADTVSFGVAPGMIMYRLLELSLVKKGVDISHIWYVLPALFIPCSAVWRLAKFNLDKEQVSYFKGVPTPAVGLTIASFPFIINTSTSILSNIFINPYFLYAVIAVMAILMVCNLPLISLKFKNFSVKSNVDKCILLCIAVLSVIFFKWIAVPIIFVAYVLVSLIFKPGKI